MSNYTQLTDFSAKDALPLEDPEKFILGSDIDAELALISAAISSKFEAGSLATQVQAEAGASNGVLMTPLRTEQWGNFWAAENAGMLADIRGLADPNADRLLGWDDSAGTAIGFTVGHGLDFSLTSIVVDDSDIIHDSLSGFVADKHIAHSSINLVAGNGLTGGGTIATGRTFTLGTPGTASLTSTNAVTPDAHTHALSGSGIVRTAPGTGGAITVSTAAASGAATNGDMWLQV